MKYTIIPAGNGWIVEYTPPPEANYVWRAPLVFDSAEKLFKYLHGQLDPVGNKA